MKKVLKSQRGMALATVLGIMAVVAILATGMFYFSYHELAFSGMDVDRARSDYLARAGVEIVSKAFPGVSGKFSELDTKPVTAVLYLHLDDAGEAVINAAEADNRGRVSVSVRQETRKVKTASGGESELEVWAYEARAAVGRSRGTAKGFTLPVAYATTKPEGGEVDEQAVFLDWVGPGGAISQGSPYTPGAPASTGGVVSSLIDRLFGTSFGEIKTYGVYYNGVVTVREEDVSSGKVSVSSSSNSVFVWAAPAVVFEAPLDLRGAGSISGVAIAANTVIFEKEIHLYADSWENRVGDLILQPLGGASQVYFNDNVYVHLGTSRYKLFDAGTVYSYDEAVDLFSWAVEHNKINTGLSGWLRRLFSDVTTGALLPVTAPPLKQPNTNSLTQVIWE